MVNDVLGWWLHACQGLYRSQASDNRQKTQASDNSLTKKSKEKRNIQHPTLNGCSIRELLHYYY